MNITDKKFFDNRSTITQKGELIMTENMSSDKLARILRVRLAREVVDLGQQVTSLGQQISGLHSNIDDFDENRKTFLQTLQTECLDHLENGTMVSAAGTIEDKYKQYLINAEMENKKEKDELSELQSRMSVLKTTAENALAQISADVLAQMYGRGELILTPKGLQRIIGRISSLNEPINPPFGIILGESDKCKATIAEIAWMCESSDQQPPLFFVDIKLMPPSEEELLQICWENDDYKLLVKNIPEDEIVWQVGSIFCLDKSSFHKSYLISRGNECVDVVRIKKSTYPHWKVEILGIAVRNKENLKALCDWGGCGEAPIELEDVSQNNNPSLDIMERYLFRQYPGVILEMPQWEGERLTIS